MNDWKRPDHVPFPTVWRRFTALERETGEVGHYRVQDLPPEDNEEALALMKRNFMRDEVLCKVTDFAKDEQSVAQLEAVWRYMLTQRISLVCYKEENEQMVAVHFLLVNRATDGDFEASGGVWKHIYNTLKWVSMEADVFSRYGVDSYVGDYGIAVEKAFRGRSIASEMLKARVQITKAIGIGLTSGVFTGEGSQAAAFKAGFEDSFSITYDELGAKGMNFDGVNTIAKVCKIMSFAVAKE